MTVEVDRAKLIDRILELNRKLEELEQVLRPMMPREWLKADVTMPQLRVLLVLLREGPTRMSALAASLEVSLATATGIVDRLVERGFVVRESSPSDRRVVMCRLSGAGEKLMGRWWQSAQDQAKRVLEGMSESQLEIVARGTEVFIEVAKRMQLEK